MFSSFKRIASELKGIREELSGVREELATIRRQVENAAAAQSSVNELSRRDPFEMIENLMSRLKVGGGKAHGE